MSDRFLVTSLLEMTESEGVEMTKVWVFVQTLFSVLKNWVIPLITIPPYVAQFSVAKYTTYCECGSQRDNPILFYRYKMVFVLLTHGK